MADQPLIIQHYRRATVYPIQRRVEEPTIHRLGIFTADGRLIPSSVADRHHGTHQYRPADPARSAPPVESSTPEAIYAGVFFHHYGHFLLESLARLWGASAHPDVPIVWIGVDSWSREPELRDWQREVLALLRITNPTCVLTEPTQFELLHVPDPGYRYADWCHPDHARFLAVYDGPPQDDSKKLWLSRRGARDGLGLTNIEIVERRLALSGWRIMSPERLPIVQQLDALAEAGVVAGEEGSAFHSLLLLKDVSRKQFHVIRRHGREHLSFRTIGHVRDVNQTFHSNRRDVVLSKVGRAVARISPNAAEILDHLRVPIQQPPERSIVAAHSVRRLKWLAKLINARSYLEVGGVDSVPFSCVQTEQKVAVSARFNFDVRALMHPNARLFEVGAETYFRYFHNDESFDLILLHAQNTAEDVLYNFRASLLGAHCRTIWLIDNVLPSDFFSAHLGQSSRSEGDRNKPPVGAGVDDAYSYKAILALKHTADDVIVRTITTGGHHQAVVWRRSSTDTRSLFDDLQEINQPESVDLAHHLDELSLRTEDQAIREVAAWTNLVGTDSPS